MLSRQRRPPHHLSSVYQLTARSFPVACTGWRYPGRRDRCRNTSDGPGSVPVGQPRLELVERTVHPDDAGTPQ